MIIQLVHPDGITGAVDVLIDDKRRCLHLPQGRADQLLQGLALTVAAKNLHGGSIGVEHPEMPGHQRRLAGQGKNFSRDLPHEGTLHSAAIVGKPPNSRRRWE